MNIRLGLFLFFILFYSILDLGLEFKYDVTVTVTTVTQSHDIIKIIEGSETMICWSYEKHMYFRLE